MFDKLTTLEPEDREHTCCSTPLKYVVAAIQLLSIFAALIGVVINFNKTPVFGDVLGIVWMCVAFYGFAEEKTIIMWIYYVLCIIGLIFYAIAVAVFAFFVVAMMFLSDANLGESMDAHGFGDFKSSKNHLRSSIFSFVVLAILIAVLIFHYYYTKWCRQLIRNVEHKRERLPVYSEPMLPIQKA